MSGKQKTLMIITALYCVALYLWGSNTAMTMPERIWIDNGGYWWNERPAHHAKAYILADIAEELARALSSLKDVAGSEWYYDELLTRYSVINPTPK